MRRIRPADLSGEPHPSSMRGEGGEQPSGYQEFVAAELYCPNCKTAMPVRERLLLVLPDGELYEYLCIQCGKSVGEKKALGKENIRIILA